MSRVSDLAVARRGPMGNAPGLVSGLTVWTPVVPGRLEELERCLEELPAGSDSPAARIETAHLARWLVVPQLVHQGPPMKPDGLRSQYLVFTAAFDGRSDDFVEALRTRLAAECDRIWGHCVGYPGAADREGFRRYLRHNELRTRVLVCTYPDATVAEIREALELKRRLVAFAIRSQGVGAAELHRSFCETFTPERPGLRDADRQGASA